MKTGDDNASPVSRGDEGWDETVLVWNGTVARIPASDFEPESVEDMAGVESKPRLRRERGAETVLPPKAWPRYPAPP